MICIEKEYGFPPILNLFSNLKHNSVDHGNAVLLKRLYLVLLDHFLRNFVRLIVPFIRPSLKILEST